ncbi:hypothetical protein D3C77_697720 [compost metagenome]
MFIDLLELIRFGCHDLGQHFLFEILQDFGILDLGIHRNIYPRQSIPIVAARLDTVDGEIFEFEVKGIGCDVFVRIFR